MFMLFNLIESFNRYFFYTWRPRKLVNFEKQQNLYINKPSYNKNKQLGFFFKQYHSDVLSRAANTRRI